MRMKNKNKKNKTKQHEFLNQIKCTISSHLPTHTQKKKTHVSLMNGLADLVQEDLVLERAHRARATLAQRLDQFLHRCKVFEEVSKFV